MNRLENLLKSFLFIVSFALVLFEGKLPAQEFTTEGKEFWFGFMENTLGFPPETLIVSMSSRVAANATVSIPLAGWSQSVTIPANTSITVGIPRNLAMASGCGSILPMGCRIQADQRISAYALNFQSYSADATLLIPNTTLGDKYFLNTYRENYSNSRQTQMLIVAAYPNTTIQITPTVPTNCGNPAGVPFQINLNQGEVYHLESDEDLTGTFVQSVDVGQGCKKFVLLSGNFCTAVGNQCCCDHLFDINFNTDTWGKNFILPNLSTRQRTRFRVVASQNGTQISVNGGPSVNLNAGQFYQFDLTADGSLTSNNPIQVMQLSMSSQVDNSTADPFMLVLGPNEQTLNEITFNTLFNSGNNPTYYVTIVTKTNSTGLLTLNNNPVTGFTPVPSNPAYSIATPTVPFGSHTIRSDSGFLAYVYEYASYESFGYSAGANLSNLFARFKYASARFDSTFCPGDTVFFQGIGDPSIISYEWDFGDGDTSKRQNPTHVYQALGDYTVKMIVQRQNSCEKDTIPGNIKILGPPITDVPDDSICIGNSITVSVTSNDTVFWSTGDTSKSITLHPTTTTTYTVYAKNQACAGLPDTFTIKVRDPKVDFTTSPKCFGNPIRFFPSASTSLQYFSWNFGDGNTVGYTSALLNYVDHTYTTPGTFQVTLAVIDSFGCKDTITKSVSIFPLINQDFSVQDICVNGVATIINNTTVVSGSITHQWNWGDGSPIDTAFAPTHVYPSIGSYNITYIAVTDSGCSDTLIKPINVYERALADFTTSDTCFGSPVKFVNNSSAPPGSSFLWLFGNGSQSSDSSPVHLYASPGTYQVTLFIITPQGCNDTIVRPVTVFPKPTANFVSDSVCEGYPVTFTNTSTILSGTFTSFWNFGDGNTTSGNNATHTYSTYGSYPVKLVLTSNNLCKDSIIKTVQIFPNPVAAFSVSDVCNDSTLVAVNNSTVPSGTLSYVWRWGDGNTSTNLPAVYRYGSSGTYAVSVTVTTDKGCADSTVRTATVILGGNVNFTATEVCETYSTAFTNTTVLKTGTNVQSYLWRFGDGNTATSANTSHTYAAPGNYMAKLVLDYGNNCFDSIAKPVAVHPKPVAAFSVSDVCNDSTLVAVNNSTVPSGTVSYVWRWGDGNTSTNLPAVHRYGSSGTYAVSVTVTTDKGCADSAVRTATVILGGNVNFTATEVCETYSTAFANTTVLKTGTNVQNYLWHFGDGNTATGPNASHTYAAPGNYMAKLVLDYGNNCFDSIAKPVTVHQKPTASFTATTVCENNPTQFTNLSSPTGLNFVWNFGDGQTSTEEAPLHLYSNDGTYSVQLIATSAYQCTDSLTMQVSVLPVGDATFSVAHVCKGDTSLFINQTNIALYPVSSFIWDFGDSTSSTASNPKKKYNSVGTYQVRLIANFANGCADTAFGFTSVNEIPSFDAQVKHVSCFGFRDGEIVLNAQTGNAPFTFNWSPALSNSAVQQNVASGKYEVTFTDVNNCSSKLSIYISQPDSLSLFVAIDSITCFGKSDGRLRAFVTGGTLPYEYRWSNGITVFENTGIPQGNYSVSVTDANGCSLIREVILPNPVRFSVNIKAEDTIQLGESITLFPSYNYSNISHWHWSPATALNCIDCENPTANPYNDIVYTVYAATEKGCIDSAFTKIYVEHQPVVYVPNVFTPNNDDVNDVAMVYANHVLHLDFFIFNRWGEKVYEGHDIHQGWDGYYKNKLQDPETYVYVVTVTFLNNKKVTKTGSITLVK